MPHIDLPPRVVACTKHCDTYIHPLSTNSDIRYSACALMLRGNVEISDVRRNIDRLKPTLRFVPWNQDGWKTGLCSVPPARQVCVMPSAYPYAGSNTFYPSSHLPPSHGALAPATSLLAHANAAAALTPHCSRMLCSVWPTTHASRRRLRASATASKSCTARRPTCTTLHQKGLRPPALMRQSAASQTSFGCMTTWRQARSMRSHRRGWRCCN